MGPGTPEGVVRGLEERQASKVRRVYGCGGHCRGLCFLWTLAALLEAVVGAYDQGHACDFHLQHGTMVASRAVCPRCLGAPQAPLQFAIERRWSGRAPAPIRSALPFLFLEFFLLFTRHSKAKRKTIPVMHRHQCALCEARNQWLYRCEAPSCGLLVCAECIGDIPGRPGVQRCVRCLRQSSAEEPARCASLRCDRCGDADPIDPLVCVDPSRGCVREGADDGGCAFTLENVDGASTARGRNLTVSHSVRCERCGDLDPVDRNLCDGPCRRWIGQECYDMYDSAVAFVDIFCFDCRPPVGDGRPSDSSSVSPQPDRGRGTPRDAAAVATGNGLRGLGRAHAPLGGPLCDYNP